MPKWSVTCWNCAGEGYVETDDEWQDDKCDICEGKGSFIVTQLTEDNCDDAIPVYD